MGLAKFNEKKLYELEINPVMDYIGYTYVKMPIEEHLAHARFGHISPKRLLTH
jgi:hypothetical protein